MRKQINVALTLAAFFVFWLFYNTSQNYQVNSEAKSWIMQGDLSNGNTPIIYNKDTGESWKFYITGSGDNVSYGWVPLLYELSKEAVGVTPKIALDNFLKKSPANNVAEKK